MSSEIKTTETAVSESSVSATAISKNVDSENLLNQYRGKRVLITGGLGMIGSSIAQKLVSLESEVTLVDSMMVPFGANHFNIQGIRDKVKLSAADIRDPEIITPLITETDIIFNLAAQVSHNDSLDDPVKDAAINYNAHLQMLETIKKHNPKAVVIHAGSRLQYGKTESVPVSEDHPMKPLTPYALNKMAAEQMYLYYHRCYSIPVILFRIANPYGPRGQIRHSKYCIINWFIHEAIRDNEITVFGDGNQIRDYIYIDDLIDAMILAAVTPEAYGEVMNLGSGEGTRFIDMAKKVVSITGSGRVSQVPWPDSYINVETGDYISDISRIKNLVGWNPSISLDQGIEDTCSYYRKNLKHYE